MTTTLNFEKDSYVIMLLNFFFNFYMVKTEFVVHLGSF